MYWYPYSPTYTCLPPSLLYLYLLFIRRLLRARDLSPSFSLDPQVSHHLCYLLSLVSFRIATDTTSIMPRFILTSAMYLALAVSSQAFVSPSFVSPRHSFPATYGRDVKFTPRPACSTALQMNLFDRFSRVAKANLNSVLQSLEDPEKIMSQALEDMQVSNGQRQ